MPSQEMKDMILNMFVFKLLTSDQHLWWTKEMEIAGSFVWAIGRELKLSDNLLTTHLDMACVARHTSSAFFNVTEMLCSLIMTSVVSLTWKQTLYWPCQCWSSAMWTVCLLYVGTVTLSQRLHYEMKCYHWVYPQTQIRFKNSLFFSLHS